MKSGQQKTRYQLVDGDDLLLLLHLLPLLRLIVIVARSLVHSVHSMGI